jgi:hypothetical protein
MAVTIRFLDGQSFEEGIRIFRRYGEAVPTEQPDTYYVSDSLLERLQDARVVFEAIDPVCYHLIPVTEAMFAEMRRSLDELHAGTLITVEDPQSLDDVIEAGQSKG